MDSYRQVYIYSRTFQGLLKVSSIVFKDYRLMKNTCLHIKILLRKRLDRDNGENSIRKIGIKLLCLYLLLHQIKTQQFYTNLGLH